MRLILETWRYYHEALKTRHSDVTWLSWHLKSLADLLFVKQLTSGSPHKGPVMGKCFHLMTSSCFTQNNCFHCYRQKPRRKSENCSVSLLRKNGNCRRRNWTSPRNLAKPKTRSLHFRVVSYQCWIMIGWGYFVCMTWHGFSQLEKAQVTSSLIG